MQIIVNGEPVTAPDGCSLSGLLDQLQVSGGRIAVELNQEIVPRSEYRQCALQAGDRLEIVQAIGGG